MQKSQVQKQNQTQKTKQKVQKPQQQKQSQSQDSRHKIEKPQESNKHLVWDCGSSLYDSFELNSFKRQLDSAIHSRTMSMPHLPEARVPPPPAPVPCAVSKKSSSNKFSRSLHKLFKSIFRSKQNSAASVFRLREGSTDEYYVVYDTSGALTTIPEVPEIDFGGLSPEINSLVRRTASERFTAAASMGISCA